MPRGTKAALWSLVIQRQYCQHFLTLKPCRKALDFRSLFVRPIGLLSALSSSKCSTYALQALQRKIFTPFKRRCYSPAMIAAKSLSGKRLTRPKVHLVGAGNPEYPTILWSNSQFRLSSLLTFCMTIHFGTRSEGTRLNSSHSQISYAVFCLKQKKNKHIRQTQLK